MPMDNGRWQRQVATAGDPGTHDPLSPADPLSSAYPRIDTGRTNPNTGPVLTGPRGGPAQSTAVSWLLFGGARHRYSGGWCLLYPAPSLSVDASLHSNCDNPGSCLLPSVHYLLPHLNKNNF
jgi:hypothetical protein